MSVNRGGARAARVVALGLGLGLLAGCLFQRGQQEPTEESRIHVEVDNQNFYDAAVYAWDPSGTRLRIGTVTGNTRQLVSVAWQREEMSFEIHLIAVGSSFSYSIPVTPGDTLELVIPPDLHHQPARRR